MTREIYLFSIGRRAINRDSIHVIANESCADLKKRVMAWINFRTMVIAVSILGLVATQVSCVNTVPANKLQEASTAARQRAEAEIREWQQLADDDVHDPLNPGIRLLQEPKDSLFSLPPNKPRRGVGTSIRGLYINKDGNKVDWVQALKDGIISPRRSRTPAGTAVEKEELVMDMDMFLDLGGSMPIVRFPHLPHTMWLACSNCHPAIFIPQSKANRISMLKILRGEQCGICHRAVAFPPTDCARCHSIDHNSAEGKKVKALAQEKTQAEEKAKTNSKVQLQDAGSRP